MAKEKENDAQAAESAAEDRGKKKRSYRKWVFMGVLLVIILAGGALGGKYYLDRQKAETAAAQKSASDGTLWAMDAFVVNLTDNAGERYLKAAIQLELSDPDLLPVVKEIKPKLRDAVIGILTSKAVKDVSTTEGKQRLKEEIFYRLNSYLSKGKILQVYFTEFVIQ